jgi:5'-nucleotidase
MNVTPCILLTNDDGIGSPGLLAAARALDGLGRLTIAAPREQSSGAGRGMPPSSDGIIERRDLRDGDREWTAYAVGGSPAQVVQHAVLEIMTDEPDLVVSGINYGENVGTAVTISGTIGAALEAASHGIPALAVSVETTVREHLTNPRDTDFTAAMCFAARFARLLLEREVPGDVHVLKVDVPRDATPDTPWEVARLSRQRYYRAKPSPRRAWCEPHRIPYEQDDDLSAYAADCDVSVLRVKRHVAVTPLSLDLTSRVPLADLDRLLR